MPSKTLMTIGASAALAFGATACSASGQGGDTTANTEMHAPVYSDKLVEAKLGPTTFAFPMNLYDRQAGPDAQGGVLLSFRWPGLESFPPGARKDAAFDAAYMDEAISVRLTYVDRVPIDSYPLRYADDPGGDPDDPLSHLSQRKKGDPVYGLTPFYADLDKVKAYFEAKGYPASRARLLEVGEDWYVGYDPQGAATTLIQCDNHLIRGAEIVAGKLEDTPQGEPRGGCVQYFALPRYKLVMRVRYLRAYMQDWKRIQAHVIQIILDAANKDDRT